MSSCLATTSRSSETPPSRGGGSCAVAAPAAKNVVRRKERNVGTRPVPAQAALVIGFLFLLGARRSGAPPIGQVGRGDLKPGGARERKRRKEARGAVTAVARA